MTDPADLSTADVEWLGLRLQHLQTLSAALGAATTEQQAIDATLNRGLDVFEADQAVIATLDESRTQFQIAAVRGYPAEVEANWSSFANTDEFPLADAVLRREPVIIHGPDELIRRYPTMVGTARSALLVCLPMGDFGGIALGYDREVTFTDRELEFMTAVVRQCSEAIRRTALDAERSRRAERLVLLADAGAAFARSLDYRTRWPRWRTWPCPGWPTAASSTCLSRPGCTSLPPCTSRPSGSRASPSWSGATRPIRTRSTARSAAC